MVSAISESTVPQAIFLVFAGFDNTHRGNEGTNPRCGVKRKLPRSENNLPPTCNLCSSQENVIFHDSNEEMFDLKEIEDVIDIDIEVIYLCNDCSEILLNISTLQNKLKQAMKLLTNKIKSVSLELIINLFTFKY